MKKLIRIFYIVMIPILIYLIVECAIGIYELDFRKYDVSIKSIDETVSYDFGKISKRYIKWRPNISSAYVPDMSLGELLKEKFGDDIVYLDDNNTISDKETVKCYVCLEGHYFYFEKSGNATIRYGENIMEIYLRDEEDNPVYDGYAYFPIAPDEYYTFNNAYSPDGEVERDYTWGETLGITSFEDLVNYYSKIDSNMYDVDEENQTITLTIFNEEGNLDRNTATVQVKVDGDNIKVKVIKN